MTRIEIKLKKPYGTYGKIHFQTATRLSKKKKKKGTQNLIKKKPAAYPWNKRRKKNKNPKTQTLFPDQKSDSLSLLIPRCTFKHTDRTCVFPSIKHKPALKRKPKKKHKP